jgi:hypothetical protein
MLNRLAQFKYNIGSTLPALNVAAWPQAEGNSHPAGAQSSSGPPYLSLRSCDSLKVMESPRFHRGGGPRKVRTCTSVKYAGEMRRSESRGMD